MASEETHSVTGDAPVPPPGEPIHLPGPSYLPVLVALGLMIALVGVILNWVIFGMGVAISAVAIIRWVSQVRQEMDDLPLEH
jgi:type IV secretory pathway TrbD component